MTYEEFRAKIGEAGHLLGAAPPLIQNRKQREDWKRKRGVALRRQMDAEYRRWDAEKNQKPVALNIPEGADDPKGARPRGSKAEVTVNPRAGLILF